MLGLIVVIGLPAVSIGIGVATLILLSNVLRRLKTMSEAQDNLDTELNDIEAALVVLTAAVSSSADKFTDLAGKLKAALDQLGQQGVSPGQLSRLHAIHEALSSEAATLSAAAESADPASDTTSGPTGDDTITAPAGDDSVAAPTGDDSVSGPTGDDTVSGDSAPTEE